MRKATTLVAMLLLLVLAFAPPALAVPLHNIIFFVGQREFTVDGQVRQMDAVPFIASGRAFVPVRYLAYALGVPEEDIIWLGETGAVSLKLGDTIVQMRVGSKTLYVNGQPKEMEVAPVVKDGRAYLPARYVAEAFGYEVRWEEKTRAVLVGPPSAFNDGPEGTLGGFAANYKAIPKVYEWHDVKGNKWTWQVPLPEEMYRYYKSQPRIHERILKEYLERLDNLRRQVEELQSYMDYWYQQCRILPGDSYYEAWQKYQMYVRAYNEAQRELGRIWAEYQRLWQLYQEAEYRQMLEGYVPYVTEEKNYELVRTLARTLAEKAPADPKERLEFVAAFVQEAIPYVSESGEYPKYPIETLVEGGDCEDKSILLAAILRAMGYRTALLVFVGNPGHMAIGVECPNCWGSYYLKDGIRYFYLETTSPGWLIGEVPPEHKGESALVYVVPPCCSI